MPWMSWSRVCSYCMGRDMSHSSGTMDWMMLSCMAIHSSVVPILGLVTSSYWCACSPLPLSLGHRRSSSCMLSLWSSFRWWAHHWPCSSWSPILLKSQRLGLWLRCFGHRWCWLASGFGRSWLLIPIIRQIEMDIHVSSIEVVVCTQRESDILPHLPAHVVLIKVSLLVWIGKVVCQWLRALQNHQRVSNGL